MTTTTEGHPPADLVRPGRAALLLGVTTRTLINWENAGLLHPVHLRGNQRRYSRAELDELNRRGGPESANSGGGLQQQLVDVDGAA